MPEYLPWTEAELVIIDRALTRLTMLGLEASADVVKSGEGIVTLSQADAKAPEPRIVIFEFHKLKRSETDARAHFVVQIQSIGGEAQALQRHGCVYAGSPLFALTKAEKDVQDGFAAKDTFDMAANAYWLKI